MKNQIVRLAAHESYESKRRTKRKSGLGQVIPHVDLITDGPQSIRVAIQVLERSEEAENQVGRDDIRTFTGTG